MLLPILVQRVLVGLLDLAWPHDRVVGVTGIRINVVHGHGGEVQSGNTVGVGAAAPLFRHVLGFAGKHRGTEFGQDRLAVLDLPVQTLRTSGATGLVGGSIDAFRRVQPVDELDQALLVLGLGAQSDHGLVATRSGAV